MNNEYECRYLFEPVDEIAKASNMFSDDYYSKANLYNNFHKLPESKPRKLLTAQIEISEAEFDAVYNYEGEDKMILILKNGYWLINQHHFRDRYSQAYPKYTFPKTCTFDLEEYKEPVQLRLPVAV